MTVARRLGVLETTLTPTQRVVAWLYEAQAFGDLDVYVDSLLDQPGETFPLNRLAREAVSATRTALKGKPAEVVDAAVRKALRETIFRFELVMRINIVGHEMLERETMLYTVFAGQLAVLVGDDRAERRADPSHLSRLAQCRDFTAMRVTELLAAAKARSISETRYLDGHVALFPNDVAEWADRLRMAQELAVMAERIAELDGVPPAAPVDPDAVSTRAALVADLVEPARSTALEKLDEGRQALAIATSWLRSKRSSTMDATEPDAPPTAFTR
ncbi:MAG: hypothetical protein WEG56_14050 [Chloroflexota bacterium]